MRGTSKVVTGWLVAVAIAVASSASAAQTAPALESAVTKAAEITKQAKALARKGQEAPQASAAGAAAGLRLDASGSVRHGENRLVYSGQYEKCYNIRFSSREGVPGYPNSYNTVMYIYANGKHIENLANPGESSDVCGTRIQVEGFCYSEKGTSFWYATERRP